MSSKIRSKITSPGFTGNSSGGGGGTPVKEILDFESVAAFPEVGATETIYIDSSTSPKMAYEWDGANYVALGDGGLISSGTIDFLQAVAALNGDGKIIQLKDTAASDNGTHFKIFRKGDDKVISFGLEDIAGDNSFGYSGSTNWYGIAMSFLLNAASGFRTGIRAWQDRDFRLGVYDADYNPIDVFEWDSYGINLKGQSIVNDSQLVLNSTGRIVSRLDYINLTYTEAQILSSNSQIVNGQKYFITDRADLGIVLVGSPDPTKYLQSGIGGFLNADFQNVGDYDLIEGITGFPKGNFLGVLNGTNTNASSVGDVGIWNAKIYQIIVDVAGIGATPTTHPGYFYEFVKSAYTTERVGYKQEWNNIEFDFSSDTISWRYDTRGNEINAYSLIYFQFGNNFQVDVKILNINCYINNLNSTGTIGQIKISNGCGVDISNSNGTYFSLDFSNGFYAIVLNNGVSHANNIYSSSGEFNFDANTSYQSKELTNSYSTFDFTLSVEGTDEILLYEHPYVGIFKLSAASGTIITDFLSSGTPYVKKLKFLQSELTGDIAFRNNGGNLFINSRDIDSGSASFKLLGGSEVRCSAEFEFDEYNNQWFMTNGVNVA